jgi:uncharacterized protein (DUF1501 family)
VGAPCARALTSCIQCAFRGRSLVRRRAEIVAALQAQLSEDWDGHTLLVCSTDDSHVVVRFEMRTLEEEPGLIAYMNVLVSSQGVASDYCLKKVVEDWNVTPGDGYLYFTFRPPWVRVPTLDTYYALHPEEKVFQDRRAAGAAAASAGLSDSGAGEGDDQVHAGTALGPELE